MTETILRRTIIAGLFALLYTPFIVADSFFFPFITGKAFFFRAIVEIMLAAWVCLAISNPAYRIRWTPIMTAFGVFVVIVGIANIFGENFQRSFWSNFERMEGFVTLLHVAALLLVVGSSQISQKVWNWFLNTSLVASGAMAISGIFEVFNATDSIRIDGTLGNSTYFAVYLLFNIFIALLLAYRNRHAVYHAVGYGLLSVVLVTALYNTGTRGSILGILVGLGIAALVTVIFGRAYPRVRRISMITLIAGVVGISLFFAFRESSFVQDQQTLARIANISLNDGTAQSRLTLWSSIAWEGFKERPLLGWGQDNFIVVFGKYYDPIMYKQEPWFDRAHNVFVDWAIAGGFLGLLSYAALFVAAVLVLVRSTMSLPEKALLVGLFSAYAVHNMFVFDNLVSYIYFAVLLAYVHGYANSHVDTSRTSASVQPSVLAGAAIGVVVVFYLTNTASIARAQTLIDALLADRQTKDPAVVLSLFDKALESEWGTGSIETYEQLAQAAMRSKGYPNASAESQRLLQERAIAVVAQDALDDPNNTRPRYFLATTLRTVGRLEEARLVLDQALDINPTRQMFLYEYAQTYMVEEDFENAEKYFKQAYDVEPENGAGLVYYAVANIYKGDMATADALLVDQFGTTTIDNDVLLDAYRKTKQFNRVIAIVELRLATKDLEPQKEASLRVSLVPLYVEIGERAKAIEQTQKAINLYPPFADQGEKMIEAIRSGQRVNVVQ